MVRIFSFLATTTTAKLRLLHTPILRLISRAFMAISPDMATLRSLTTPEIALLPTLRTTELAGAGSFHISFWICRLNVL
jgi:hypothetical protein